MFSYFQPAAAVAAFTPWVIFPQMGSSHCSQKNVLLFTGAAFIGVVIPTLVGGLVMGFGVDVSATEAPVLVPELLLLEPLEPHAATVMPRTATAGMTIRRYHVPFFISPPTSKN